MLNATLVPLVTMVSFTPIFAQYLFNCIKQVTLHATAHNIYMMER